MDFFYIIGLGCSIIAHISRVANLSKTTIFTKRHCSDAPMILLIIQILNTPGRVVQWDSNIHFFIFQSHKLLKTHFDQMIYNIVSCFVCVSGCFAAVQYMGDINSNPRGVQEVHTRTHTRQHIFLVVLLLNKFFLFPKFHSGSGDGEGSEVCMVRKKFWPSLSSSLPSSPYSGRVSSHLWYISKYEF